MSKDFTGAGFLVGGILGGQANRAAELDAARYASAEARLTNIELSARIDELETAVMNVVGSQVRLKADYEGMRAVIRDLMSAIKEVDRESPMLLAKNRDTIAGEASRLSDDKNRERMYSPQMSRRAGMMAVILSCTEELARLAPSHKLLQPDERFASYWVAYQEEIENRKASTNQVVSWAQDRDRTDKAILEENSDFYEQVPAVQARRAEKNGPKPS